MTSSLKQQWLSNLRPDILSGLVVALALIPEAIAFSIIAGVDPKVGLYASFSIAVVTAIAGGRPGMISAATGAMALLMVDLVKDHGLEYLLAATVLTGVIQIIFGYFKLGSLMRFVSRSVVTGFVNALAILIFMAQLPELTNVTWHVYAMTAAGLGIIYLLPLVPKVGKLLPSPLVCIIVLTIFAMVVGLDIRTVGDMGELPDSLPVFLIPDIPFNLETLWIILPYSLPLAVVGLLESLMTATLVDDLTDTPSDKNRECKGQGAANVVTGFLGGMAGCAMIGQTMINVKSGGRTRLSTMVAGVVLLILVVFLGPWVSQIPMAALVAVMIMVSIGTFSWQSIRDLKTHPMSTNIVMLGTVAVVVATHNLAIGVLVGVLLSALFFANKIGQVLHIGSDMNADGRTREYRVVGQVFFASSEQFQAGFDLKETVERVVIDVSRAHFWDITAIGALDTVVVKFRREGTEVEVRGLNEASATLVDRFAVHDKPDAVEKLMGH
ncbi:SulP family inorganic anion transporter [Cobetia sp. cqz5-12]|jgi:SulP family sulfate permease|uniref:SulP family inorganic anion transporter n=1 Tax=Cobetia amphilecti TaxID=1055104 RepID=A0AAP4U203_9GAMM|nr:MULTISPECIES: SulP family inorganic anion transporter [Cobetia]AVV34785.1 SulP family inorganic anion transporter [Halomonas sp. SF2003]MBR9798910.1 SulP family inorganic anion transporter [Gammaproteobacteria bacterium]KPM81027.1 sulfate transporter [Cobetia sp. UCD-24C]MBE2166980.1 SulP family inorganic anion transporter [Cobetia sp. 2AS1]MBF10093.1 SulP family inorganic anion transporter [Cobetia sp.]|tara:strand:- start:38 stop:1525 length:1488 start_codon:yes stop_codon:yes gene_type:complete